MSIRHQALTMSFVALLLGAGMSTPSIAPAHGHATAGAKAGRKARQARKRLMRAIRRKGLASLRAVSGALASNGTTQAADVVGTPPTLVDVANGDPSQIFWRPGVVAAIGGGTATPGQCAEFWAGQSDGVSAGLGACRMAEDLAQSFGRIVQSENSLCYMRNVPTPANVASGGLQVLSGNPPGGDLTRLFSVPAGTDRIVEVRVTGQEKDERVMLRVANAAANRAAGNLYRVDLWFCSTTPGTSPNGVEHLTLDTSGHLTAVEGHAEDGETGLETVSGWVVGDGPGAAWDTTRARTADVLYGQPDGAFKSSVQVAGDVISTRSWGNSGGDWRGFTMTRFSGAGPAETRFLSGAFAEGNGSQTSTGTAEYRAPIYVAAPGSDLVSQVAAVDLTTDPFFVTPPSAPTVDTTGYACDTSADVVLAMNFANPAIAAIRVECEGPRLDNIQLCQSNPTIQTAEQNYLSSCGGPH